MELGKKETAVLLMSLYIAKAEQQGLKDVDEADRKFIGSKIKEIFGEDTEIEDIQNEVDTIIDKLIDFLRDRLRALLL